MFLSDGSFSEAGSGLVGLGKAGCSKWSSTPTAFSFAPSSHHASSLPPHPVHPLAVWHGMIWLPDEPKWNSFLYNLLSTTYFFFTATHKKINVYIIHMHAHIHTNSKWNKLLKIITLERICLIFDLAMKTSWPWYHRQWKKKHRLEFIKIKSLRACA